ncbi:MAG TPA: glycoside hydrolase family 3 N-terminal domain-containing protein [Lacunisphaera sp.]|nr:glycoside hydrolase family 3 N-terminal domain-containing protein [Lacunisphaera sp.]
MALPRPPFSAGGLLAALLPVALLPAAAPAPGLFIRPTPSAALHHEGWIDLNKNGARDPYEDAALPVEARLDDLIARMTDDEKTAQLATLYGFPRVLQDELPTAAWKNSLWKDGIGNIDEHLNGNIGERHQLPQPKHAFPWSQHVRALNEVQRWFVEQTRLGIPVDFTNEGIRGLLHTRATSFPAAIGIGSTWNAPLVREIGRITGREAHALGYTNIYSPVLDLPRDPRWGRIVECYSEDPFLTGTLGAQQVRGIQEQHVVSTVKHFAVYGIPKGGRDGEARTDSQASWRDVQALFLEPFRRAIRDAGALGVMASYNDYDGVPIETSRLFLTEILRQEWGFRGYVVSDSGAVEWVHTKHRTATTPAEAIRQSVEAGLNIRTHFTAPEEYVGPLRDLVRTGRLSRATLDARVRDVLRVKYWLGLFDRPYRADPDAVDRVVRQPAHLAASIQAARESIVLLKNDQRALPLRRDLRRVLVTGPLANDPHAWWSRYGPQDLAMVTPLAGIRARLGDGVEVRHVPGVDVKDERYPESDVWKEPPSPAVRAGIDAAVAAARDVDVIIAVLGETDALCRESAGRTSLDLPGHQEDLLRALHATGRPVVLVLSNGRPLSINWAARHVPAIVELWMPGENGGTALAEVLCGDYNPAGRLPVTFPRTVGQIPLNFPTHPGAQGRDPGMVTGPLFPFGHGLSYTTFQYANLRIFPAQPGPGATVQVECDITNAGERDGDEVVQLYVRDDYSSVITFEKTLRGFARVPLRAGESRRLQFTLTPADLALYNQAGQWTVEPGRFTVMLGASSEDIRLTGTFTIPTPEGALPDEAPLPDGRMDPR